MTLNITLMRAAAILLHHGEYLPVVYIKPSGKRMGCRLAGFTEDGQEVILTVWYDERLCSKAVLPENVELPRSISNRLQRIARAQLCAPLHRGAD